MLNNMYEKRRLIFIAIVGVFALWILWLLISRFLLFSLISSNPAGGDLSLSQTKMRFTFNRELDVKKTQANLNPSYGAQYFVKGSELTIKLTSEITEPGMIVKLLINAISVDGSTNKIERQYTTKPTSFGRLSDEQKNDTIKNSSSFEDSFPLLNKLPITTKQFEIVYEYPDTGVTKMPIIVTSLSIDYNNPAASADSPSRQKLFKQDYAAAHKTLLSLGFTKDKYQLFFTDPYFLNEYDARSLPRGS